MSRKLPSIPPLIQLKADIQTLKWMRSREEKMWFKTV
jgi:hypothetical protein